MVRVYFCPECKSVEVRYTFGIGNLFGVLPRMKCFECGYTCSGFPVLVADEVDGRGKMVGGRIALGLKKKDTDFHGKHGKHGGVRMGVVEFKFDKERDLRNIWETANSGKSYGYDFKKRLTKNILEICRGKEYSECKRALLKTMGSLYKNPLIGDVVSLLGKSWGKIESEYFGRLENLTGQKFPFKKVDAYLTTSGMCPYDCSPKSPSFYFSFFWGIPGALQASGHELMHLHLHNISWWKKVEGEIGREKTHDLKESLTELLNLEFRDLWIADDNGYSAHEKLRKYISSQWRRSKDFDLLTEKCVKWIRRNGVR